jgi:hypothetical protein
MGLLAVKFGWMASELSYSTCCCLRVSVLVAVVGYDDTRI